LNVVNWAESGLTAFGSTNARSGLSVIAGMHGSPS
jgi:hypothetical protein